MWTRDEPVVKAVGDDAPSLVRFGKLQGEPRRDRRELARRLLERSAIRQAPDHREAMIAAVPRRIGRERRQHLVIGAPLKRGRQHADHRVGQAVERQRSPNRIWIRPERAPPEPVADDDDARVAARPVFLIEEIAAERRRHLQRAQKRRGDVHAGHGFGISGRGPGEPSIRHRGERLEALGLAAPIEEVGVGCGERRPVVRDVAFPDADQPVRVREGQWPQHDRVDHAEDGGVGADAEGQRDCRDERESRAFP